MPSEYLVWLLLVTAVVALLAAGLLVARRLARREPYARILRLRTRAKVRFLRAILGDPRVPFLVKLLPIFLIGYLASPIDLIPDFLPVLGYLDDLVVIVLVIALIVQFTPAEAIAAQLDAVERSADDVGRTSG